MNQRNKEVLHSQLENEEKTLASLKRAYAKALRDVKEKIDIFQADIALQQAALDKVTDQSQREILASQIQSKIYQKQYQQALKGQLSAVYDNLNSSQYETIKSYIDDCYQSGFIGVMYDIQGQGVPLILAIDPADAVNAVLNDTKLSASLYDSLGFDIKQLKKSVNQEISRGIASALSSAEIAQNIEKRTSVTMNKAYRIARTEGHRVTNHAAFDAQKKAVDSGADVVKQWDSTLDGSTRGTHIELDGQVRELDEDFTCSGGSAPYPGGFGDPSEDCNCRCCLLQRVRGAVKDESTYQKWNNETGGFIECSGYADFKERYLKILNESDIISTEAANGLEVKSISVHTLERAAERGVTSDTIVDSLQNPLHIGSVVTDDFGRNSQRFIGNIATVNVNPDSGKVTTVWKTGKTTRKKYTKKED